MGLKLKGIVIAVVCSVLVACSGGLKENPLTNGIVIPVGTKLYIDLSEANQFQVGGGTIELRKAANDFAWTDLISDITNDLKLLTPVNGKYTYILRKDTQTTRPMIVMVDAPLIGVKFVDVLFDKDTDAKPGLVSTLAYDLIKNYPNKQLGDYNSEQWDGIKSLVQARVLTMLSQSENLSYSSAPYATILRYFKNGLSRNPEFMTAIRAYGINYHSAGKTAADPFDTLTPPGLRCEDTPEGCATADGAALANYQYVDHLKVTLTDGSVVSSNPFDQANFLPQLMPSVTSPFPGQNISVAETQKVRVTAKVLDVDNDYIDKSMHVEYIPRKLPPTNTVMVPEATASTTEIQTNGPDETDGYVSDTISLSEALDLNVYSDCSSDPDPLNRTCDTAYRNVYYLYSDGSVLIAAKWNFRYIDMNRAPEFLTDSNGHIDIDDPAVLALLKQNPTDSFHTSYCDTDLNNISTRITSKNDNPWSCIFRTYDPDLDVDPNGAADTFYYTVANIDPFVELFAGKPSQLVGGFLPATKVNPIIPAGPAPLVQGQMSTGNCGTHLRCGIGVFQLTVDNGVKVAAETKSTLLFDYTIVAYDRPVNGYSSSRLVQRYVDFTPVPARFVAFDQADVPPGIAPASDANNIVLNPAADIVPSPTPGGFVNLHTRKEIYLTEIIRAAKGSAVSDGTLAPTYGFIDQTGAARNSKFVVTDLASANHSLHKIITQPRKLSATPLGTPSPALKYASYTFPYEHDSTCTGAIRIANNSTQYDATAPGDEGWVFEIDAVDLDNVGLKPGEPSDPVYLNKRPIVHDALTSLNSEALKFCAYTAPTSDPTYYQKYANDAAMDACTWQSTPPLQMQPIPVFYNDGGVNKKLVYHRLRVKWQPKDEKALGAYAYPGVLQNTIRDLVLWGNRPDPRDGTVYDDILNLYAKRKEMTPCTTLAGTQGTTSTFEQYTAVSDGVGKELKYTIKDENKRGGYVTPASSPNPDWRLSGRQQIDVSLYSSAPRAITDSTFLTWVPFIKNCTTGQSSLPLTWYSLQGDAAAVPHARMNSQINSADICFGASFKAVDNLNHLTGGKPTAFRSVVLIYNKLNQLLSGAKQITLNSGGSKCFPQDTIDIFPNQSIVAIASSCDYTASQINDPTNNPLWDDADSKAIVAVDLKPSDYGILPGNLDPTQPPYISFNWLPQFFRAANSAGPNANAFNSVYFAVTPFDTYRSDTANIYGGGNYYVYSASAGVTGPGITLDPVKNFYIAIPSATPGSEYGLLDTAAPNIGPKVAPTGSPYDAGFQVVDWNYPPNTLALYTPTPTPTPDASTNVYFKEASNTIQIFIKNGGTATIPLFSADNGGNYVEKDPFDVHSYSISSWSGGARPVPTLTRTISGSNCGVNDYPAGYPGNITNPSAYSTLYSTLTEYRKCNLSWTPDITASKLDDGKTYTFNIDVIDNPSSIGAIYPDGAFIANPSSPNDYGHLKRKPASITVVENNQDPVFTATSGGAALATTLASVPTLSSYPTPPANATYDCKEPTLTGGVTAESCPETLYKTSAEAMVEGTETTFTIYVKSNSKTTAFKTLTATKPNHVRILENAGTVKQWVVPSFSTLALTQNQDTTNGTLTVTFKWKPTDKEAFNLSTVDGFLIPLDVTNNSYDPSNSANGFPTDFKVPARRSRVWIWAKAKVTNTAPVVQIMKTISNGTPDYSSATSLQDYTAQVTAGQINVLRLQFKKTADVEARTSPAVLTDPLQPTLVSVSGNENVMAYTTLNRTIYTADAGSGFLGCPGSGALPSPTPAPGVSGSPSVYKEEYPITFCPGIAEAGKQYLLKVQVADPGDVSRGLSFYEDPTTTCNSKAVPDYTCRAMADATVASKVNTYQFLVRIEGPPQFVSPKTGASAYAYINENFNYPLALNITRASERRQPNFFIGIDYSAANTAQVPMKTATTFGGAGFSGFMVNEKYILKWWGLQANGSGGVQPSTPFSTSTGPKSVPLLAVVGNPLNAYNASTNLCQASNYTLVAGDKDLIRYNEQTGTIQHCKVKAADFGQNGAASALAVEMFFKSAVPEDYKTTSSTQVLTYSNIHRTYTVKNPGSPQTEVNQQFADFKGRCESCDISPSTTGTSVNGYELTSAGNLSVQYGGGGSNNGYVHTYAFDGTTITKDDSDSNPATTISPSPTPIQRISISASEGETLTFAAKLDAGPIPASAPYPVYHWYANGCLVGSGTITPASTCVIEGATVPCVSQNIELTTLMSGRNDDCSGKYAITEPESDSLGKLVLRLTIGTGTESYSTSAPVYDGTNKGYVWNTKVLNVDPIINTDPQPSGTPNFYAPLALNSLSGYTGGASSSFAMPVSFAGNEFIAYTDEDSTASVKVRLRQIDIHGDITNQNVTPATANPLLTVDCAPSGSAALKSSSAALKFLGIKQDNSSGTPKLNVALSIDDKFLNQNSSSLYDFRDTSKNCYSNTLSMSTTSVSGLPTSSLSNSLVASALTYVPHSVWTNPLATYTAPSGTDYLMYNIYGVNKFWDTTTLNTNEVVSSLTELSNFDSSNQGVKKLLVSGTKAFYLIGNTQENSPPDDTNTRGYVVYRNLEIQGTRLKTNSPAPASASIAFTNSASPNPQDCTFNGIPTDAAYVSETDTLIVLAATYGGGSFGRLVSIQNISTSPTCKIISDKVQNPSYKVKDHNPNVIKTVYDKDRRLVYGIITPPKTVNTGAGTVQSNYSGQFYVVDPFTEKVVLRDLPVSVVPYSLVYSRKMNSLYIYDNQRIGTRYPTLYRVW